MTGIAKRRMEGAIFDLALDRLGITHNGRENKSYEGARLLMVEGRKISQAVRICRVTRRAIYKAMDNVETAFDDLGICAYCGLRLPPELR